MPKTPDRIEGELLISDSGADPVDVGGLRNHDGVLRARDQAGVFDLRFSHPDHKVVDLLVHELAETSYVDLTRDGNGQTVVVTIWTDTSKTTKLRELVITRVGGQASQLVEKQYDATGALVQMLTHSIHRAAGRVASIQTTES